MARKPDSSLIQRIRRNRRRIIWIPVTVILGVLLVLTAFHVRKLDRIVTDRFEGNKWSLPSKLYSDAFVVHPGQDIKKSDLSDRLARLGYHSVSARPERPGEYFHATDHLDVYLHPFSYPDREAEAYPVRLAIKNGTITKIVDLVSEDRIPLIELEPELIAAYYDETWEERDLVRLTEVSPHLIQAILAVEDARFYQHHGIDPRGIVRAVWVNLKNRAVVQGGSTITQQLVKNFYLDHRRTLTRKVNEAAMAILLEVRYEKEEILEAYLNEIYFGQGGSMGVFGVGQAARFYYGKRPGELTLPEAALLAGVINAPGIFSPFHDPEKAAVRQRIVLDRMRKLGMITEPAYRRALEEPFRSPPPVLHHRMAPYFSEFVRQQLAENYPAEILNSEGLRIFTTLDMQAQRRAEASLARGLERLETRYPALRRDEPLERLQGALIALQPQTGYVRAMVGGRDYAVSQFNRVTQARRQPGSLFKIFVYAAAIANGSGNPPGPLTPASLLEDVPITITTVDGDWTPENYDQTFRGTVTLGTALADSLNVATVRLAEQVGGDRIIAMARALGVESPLVPVPSLALGTSEVTLLEMAVAYAAIANSGVRPEPLAIKEVVMASGEVAERRTMEVSGALTPQQAYVLTHLLSGAVERGTARDVRNLGIRGPVAGKTGTSSDYRDAWFAGYTPDLLALTWVGFDARDAHPPVPLTGANAALPIWAEFIRPAEATQPSARFAVPSGIVFRKVDPHSGRLANRQCPGGIEGAFVKGTEPDRACGASIPVARGFMDWVKKIFSTN
jgi:penicillin-binding protein 1B